MDLRKFALIVEKDLRLLIQDRATLMIILVTPFLLTLVLGAAFGNMASGGESSVKDISLVVANADQGILLGQINFGNRLTDALKSTGNLLAVETVADEATARRRVSSGSAVAALLIPADFSQALDPSNANFGNTKMHVTVVRDPGQAVPADIASAVVRQVLNGFANATIVLNAGNKVAANPLFLTTQSNGISEEIANKSQSGGLIKVSMTQASNTTQTQGGGFNMLAYFAPAMAVFFLNFSMAFGAVNIIEEKDNWTLQRLLISPTNRLTVLAGKLGGTYVSGLLQVGVLIVATTLVGPVLGSKTPVWGTNIPALIVLTLCVVAGAIGVGTILAAIARKRQQAGIYSSAVLTITGIIGGSFFSSGGRPPFGILSKITVNYWATNAYATLSQTNDLSAVMPNIVVLLIIFAVCFTAGVILFNRRLEA